MKLYLDTHRWENRTQDRPTGIYVHALDKSNCVWSADIYYLAKESLLTWLRGQEGENLRAENVVGILLGWGNLHEEYPVYVLAPCPSVQAAPTPATPVLDMDCDKEPST